ncbi:FAD/NAD(P)-binding domain-containing protein [Lentithecium fluviatile CBS 122367]|uniref:FAD/NAD(P)-binding domain-containing protein n=1 Tax=Lentithecium fluviatile CBS 122367 TaxID=1168545 RepID=A0A6G1IIN5_9PLEO|nr:FAD/NAD(P)-binding domain-containing protein [Lentithecium fluviatile CBS 122367]
MDPATMSPERLKYAQEAAKRQRSEGTKQYVDLHYTDNDRLRSLIDDPFADHKALDGFPSPLNSGDHIKFLILGAGIGGIVSAVRLVQAGFTPEQIVIAEVAGGVGGTWYWNRYPGLHCDVEAYVYLPLLEETGYMPTQKYASGVEIRTYLVQLLQRFGLLERVLFRTKISGLQWDDGNHTWRTDMTTTRGPEGKEKGTIWANAEFVILVSGVLHYSHVPKIPGMAGFEGAMFHTSRWDYNATGGLSDTPFPKMDKLEGKRVGIIGTGATSVQVVPEVSKYAKEVYVFQRTPSQVFTRGQRNTELDEWREKIATGPGWQAARMENLSEHLAGHNTPGMVNLVDDEWSKLKAYCAVIGSKQFGIVTPDKIPKHIGKFQAIDEFDTTRCRKRISDIVQNKDTAEKLMAWYFTWCKRPTFSDVYLQSFNKPNVHLIDTDGKGVDSLTPHGVIANNQEYPIDILILSTGFRSPGYAAADQSARLGIEIVGRNNLRLTDKVAAKGATSLHGVFTHDFPNLFWCNVGQTAATASYTHTLDVLGQHVAYIISEAHKRIPASADNRGKRVVIEPSEAAEEAYCTRLMQGAAYYSSLAVCTPSYITLEGEYLKEGDQMDMMKKARGSPWSEGMVSFTRMLEGWREGDRMEGVEVVVV